jgi:hypothetical protein
VVSAEFNLCYRWHSCISEKDDKWIEEFYYDLFGKPGSEITVQDLIMGFAKFEGRIPEDPLERPFNKFKRGPDGKFSDDDLVECITSAVEDCAGSFGARNVPASMRAIEILGIIQGRKWNVSGLNQFRKHFGLKPYESFEDINSDPGVAESLRRLYDHPDFVELYPGLVAEEHKEPMVPGVGIAPTYTISRVVLSDAVCLVRGDRHYTVDYSPRNLTNWGYNDVQYDLNVNHGCVFYKLFIRAFPHHFKYNSVYAHYPMVVPSETAKILKDLKRDHLFDFSRPARLPQPTELASSQGAARVFANKTVYKGTWHANVELLANGAKTKLSQDATAHDTRRREASQPLGTADIVNHVRAFYRKATEQLLNSQSYHLGGLRMADLVRDVANIAPTYFASSLFDLSLRTKENPKGIYTEHELYAVLSTVAAAVFTNPDPVKKFPLVEAAKTVAAQLASIIERSVKSQKAKKNDPLSAYGVQLIKALSKAGTSTQDITWSHVLTTCAAIVPYQAKLVSHSLPKPRQPSNGAQPLTPPTVRRGSGLLPLSQGCTVPRDNPLARRPASLRADRCPAAGLRPRRHPSLRLNEAALPSHSSRLGPRPRRRRNRHPAGRPRRRLLGKPPHTHHHPRATTTSVKVLTPHVPQTPSNDGVDPLRPRESYIYFAALPSSTFLAGGREMSEAALTEMFRALFKRRNVRRAPGPQGELKKVVGVRGDGAVEYLREDWGAKGEWPVTMKVCWDDE